MRLLSFPFTATGGVNALTNAGNPNGAVVSVFVGQLCVDTTVPGRSYIALTAGVNNDWHVST
jgi:hypothetical protein